MLKMTLKFLSDKNIPSSLVKALRNKGHNVKDIKEEKLFAEERQILQRISGLDPEEAKNEIAHWFSKSELFDYQTTHEHYTQAKSRKK